MMGSSHGFRRALTSLVVVAALAAALAAAGCAPSDTFIGKQTEANSKACGAEGCHDDFVDSQDGSAHSALPCTACHEGTGEAHAADPQKAIATTDWTIASCSGCHEGEAATYVYDDNVRVGPFGGSIREPAQPKSATFPQYNKIVAGHAFSKDYNEEGAHRYMLADHYATTRGKFETCVQCKSSKLAVAWNSGKPLRVAKDEKITLTHTAKPGVAAKVVTIPKGTVITYKTDASTRLVDAKATLPDGKVYSSMPKASEDATANYNMVWASTIAAIKDTWPYGAGCNHCHDPHTGEKRIVRKALIESIAASGVNPYQKDSAKDFSEASAKDQRIMTCAQCHVEYTCGKSGVDKQDRDAYGWTKAAGLHDKYTDVFGYKQDWKNALIGEPLIKNQHPETELYWNSVHYDAGASCGDCHMPEVQRGGKTIRSHWFTSPYKYTNAATYGAFAAATGLTGTPGNKPCARCHSDRTAQGIAQQKAFFAAQAEVEKLLSQSITGLAAMKSAGKGSSPQFAKALEGHRRAHAIWENLAVSENSMGFHNYAECMSSMAEAKKQVSSAIVIEKSVK